MSSNPIAESADSIHRFIFEEQDIRGEIVSLNQSFNEASQHQNLDPVVQNLLGEFLAAAALLAEILKFKGILTLQARGDGPIPMIMAESTDTMNIRGIAKTGSQFSPDLAPDLNFKQLIGNGVLSLTIDPIKGQRYQGIVPLERESLAECLNDYFAQSEQLPTKLWLFAEGNKAGGLQIQALPSKDKEAAEENWQTAEALAQTVKAEEILNLDHSEVLYRLFNEFEIRMFDQKPIAFACSCDRQRSLNALLSLGQADAEALIAERDWIEIDCQFCGTQYKYGEADVQQLFAQQDKPLH